MECVREEKWWEGECFVFVKDGVTVQAGEKGARVYIRD